MLIPKAFSPLLIATAHTATNTDTEPLMTMIIINPAEERNLGLYLFLTLRFERVQELYMYRAT